MESCALKYDKTNPKSIFDYATRLVGQTLRSIIGDQAIAAYNLRGKGGFNQMIEKLYFEYDVNSCPEPDFREAGVELKGTALKELKDKSLQIKERLVIDMIDYCEVVNHTFEDSLFYRKCRLMLLLFYLYQKDVDQVDWEFIYVVLWKIPSKDLLIIKHDYQVIINKIKRGEAHLLSEGDTEYLGACRKGQKGDPERKQPYSDILAAKRAFSLKPSYMRTVLNYIKKCGKRAVINYQINTGRVANGESIVETKELQEKSFEQIILDKFVPYKGMTYAQICDKLGIKVSKAKNRYALIAQRIIMNGPGNPNKTDEFLKAGLQMKTIRVEAGGNIEQSMSFENIDYSEVYENDNWFDSRLYEIFSGRFLFVIFKADGDLISFEDGDSDNSYSFDRAFFWTMPQEDLLVAEEYWNNIRKCVLDNHIAPKYFFKLQDHKHFHVRPKARVATDLAENPNGGYVKKYCYWFNNEYIQKIERENR